LDRVAAFLTLFDHNQPKCREGRHLSNKSRAVLSTARDDCVQLSLKFMSQPKLWRRPLVLGAILVFIGTAAQAQNLDQGKSAPRLFADSCATCHRSARGLAKGRFRLTLFLFLQDHYASNSSTAWELTSYLESVDNPPGGRSRAAAAKPSHAATWAPRSPIRPPMPVPPASARSN
jgi:mono/diheme cytochrome c family protein